MPLKVFWKFWEYAGVMEAAHYSELLDIAVIPSLHFDQYKTRKAKYNAVVFPNITTLPPKPPEMHLDAGAKETHQILKNVFRAVRRGTHGR